MTRAAVGMCGRDPTACQGGTSIDGWIAIGSFLALAIVALVVVAWKVFRR